MDGADASRHYGDEGLQSNEQSPSLLTIILDTNPAAWAFLDPVLTISTAVANLLVFINAHLACNYTNQVAVIASHCDKAQWLYPTATPQQARSRLDTYQRRQDENEVEDGEGQVSRNKRIKLNVKSSASGTETPSFTDTESNKYRPFRLIEEELVRNLRNLMSSTSPVIIHEKSSTMIAGALSLALSYINRRSQEYQESLTGISASLADQSANAANDPNSASNNTLQSRIMIITLSPSTDLAHQYIPIMNSIFACQRLNIPIDVLQLPSMPARSRTPKKNKQKQQSQIQIKPRPNLPPSSCNKPVTPHTESLSTPALRLLHPPTHPQTPCNRQRRRQRS